MIFLEIHRLDVSYEYLGKKKLYHIVSSFWHPLMAVEKLVKNNKLLKFCRIYQLSKMRMENAQ